ncbi:MAG: PAS domain-containing protein [Parvularculaceae bacterium]|nr:PAS domain-containing protein [Parvularculaceae bacterium]
MAESELAALIQTTARSVRRRDFLWSSAIALGVAAATVFIAKGDVRITIAAFSAFIAALAVRYLFSSGRAWAKPVQRVVERDLSAREAELTTLRLARGVALVLPEPIFILDDAGVIELANPAAEEFLGAGGSVEGRHFAAVLRTPAVFDAVEHAANGGEASTVDFTTTGAVERACRAFVARLEGPTRATRILVFIRDLTSERRLEQMRADFIASASHELRTPLASLLGFIETLRGPARGDEEARDRFLGIMQGQAERMQRLVFDLMSLSRIELHEHVPPSGRIDVAEIARDVIDSLAPILSRSGAIVDFEMDGDASTKILGDRDETFQAAQNLIDNALKYGGDPALVKVRVGRGAAPSLSDSGEMTHRAGDAAMQVAARRSAEVADLVYLQVRDFGPGIERGDLPRLTERFYRANVDRNTRERRGTGLGLAIVKHIVNRHKGGLQIETRPGGGTAFTCYFRALDGPTAVAVRADKA